MNETESPAPQQPAYDPSFVQQFLDNQTVELHIKQQELEIKKKEVDNSHEYAVKLLDAQLVDRQQTRQHDKANSNLGGCIVLIVSLAVIGSLCYALHLNKDQFVKEFLQTLVIVLSSGGVGYSIGAAKKKKDDKSE